MKKFTLVLTICSIILIFAVVSFAGDEKTIYYRIKPVPKNDRTELAVSVKFKGVAGAPTKISLPTDCFGAGELAKYVVSITGAQKTSVEKGGKENERLVRAGNDGWVSLEYTMSFDPQIFDEYSYGPNVGQEYFHIAGCQFLLHVGDDDEMRPYEFEMRDIPAGWKPYSSFAPDADKFKLTTSYENLASGVIGAGKNSYDFKVRDKSVSVFIHGKYRIPDQKIYSAIERIVRLQRDWFNDYSQPFYRIVIAPRSGHVAGYAPANSFICFVKSDITELELNWLLSHELFHNWLGNKIRIERPPETSFIKYEWFTEGVNDYFARRILLEAKLITPQQFVDYINKDIINIADNPQRNKTMEELASAAKANQYGTAYRKLSYYRGGLLALKWDTELKGRNSGKTLSDFIRELYQIAERSGGKVKEQVLFDLARTYGFDLEKDLENHIVKGESITLLPDSAGSDYELRKREMPSFDPGFDLPQTFQSRKISGVVETGAAYRAGLRDGMEFVNIENSNRFANAWYADKPLVVTVKDKNTERRFEYFPHGAPLKLQLFERR